jgi:hypothetical protein
MLVILDTVTLNYDEVCVVLFEVVIPDTFNASERNNFVEPLSLLFLKHIILILE